MSPWDKMWHQDHFARFQHRQCQVPETPDLRITGARPCCICDCLEEYLLDPGWAVQGSTFNVHA